MKEKKVVVKSDLVKMGYPKRMIDELKYSDDFPKFGFKYGRTFYFYPDQFEKYVKEHEQDE